jgi:hypothetical protein
MAYFSSDETPQIARSRISIGWIAANISIILGIAYANITFDMLVDSIVQSAKVAGLFDGLVGKLQDDSMLRICRFHLTWTLLEEFVVEGVVVVYKVALPFPALVDGTPCSFHAETR